MKHILIMGAGKVGQDLTAHLKRAGLDVTLLARPRQREELLSRGVSYLTRGNQIEYDSISNSNLATSIDELARKKFDAAIACFRSEQRYDVKTILGELETLPPVAAFAFPVWPRTPLDFLPEGVAKAFIVPRIYAFRGPIDPSSTRVECIDPASRPLCEALLATTMRAAHVERLREAFARNLVLGLPAIEALAEHGFRARALSEDRRAVEAVLDYQESLAKRLPEVSRPRIPPRFLRRRILRNLDTLFSIGRRDIVEAHVRSIAQQASLLLEDFETLYKA